MKVYSPKRLEGVSLATGRTPSWPPHKSSLCHSKRRTERHVTDLAPALLLLPSATGRGYPLLWRMRVARKPTVAIRNRIVAASRSPMNMAMTARTNAAIAAKCRERVNLTVS